MDLGTVKGNELQRRKREMLCGLCAVRGLVWDRVRELQTLSVSLIEQCCGGSVLLEASLTVARTGSCCNGELLSVAQSVTETVSRGTVRLLSLNITVTMLENSGAGPPRASGDCVSHDGPSTASLTSSNTDKKS